MPATGGYRGTPVGSCSQKNADEECRDRGYKEAETFECGTASTCGGFFGCFDQDVMYSVTCGR